MLKSLNEKYPDSERININQETSFLGFEGYKNAIDLADVVILTTPPAFRPLHFEYAINNNKHVFMEKPVATDIDGIKRITKTEIGSIQEIKCCWSSKALPKKL